MPGCSWCSTTGTRLRCWSFPARNRSRSGPIAPRLRRVLDDALARGTSGSTRRRRMEVLAAYGIPVIPTRKVRDADEAARAAAQLGLPVALKIVAQEIVHKSEVGGVALDLASADAVRRPHAS